jgi:uncharacterized protein (DUF1697 family)
MAPKADTAANQGAMLKYLAFLRGINVGGHKPIKMDALAGAFGSLGFQNVKTILASGNVLFDAPKSDSVALAQKIEAKLETVFGHSVGVTLRTIPEIQKLVKSDPFKNITVTPQTRLYVTFRRDKTRGALKIPYQSPEKDFQILRISTGEVCTVLTLSPERQTTQLMNILEKEFGKTVTTRNWNTVLKILKSC